ncbi:MAG: TatD family hydrolase [Ruminiclostridium sp.]|nr:TatD family hydrolase [Ruminiclostridium sp.]
MNRITDTHAHYDDPAFDSDRYELLGSLLQNKCENIVTLGCDIGKSRFSLELAEKYNGLYAAVGVHPENCGSTADSYLSELRKLASHPKTVAVGEIGLDYHYEGFDRCRQIRFFSEQLELASELELPVCVHSRDSTKDVLDVLRKYKPKGVVHCFSGSVEVAEEILSFGMMISFTGLITFKNSKKAAEACRIIPIERIMLETDCPYMAPVPHRGERNDSGNLIFIAEKIAEIKGLNVDDVISICNDNAEKLFGFGKKKG